MSTKLYKAKGLILGETWSGGQGVYPAREYTATSKEDLEKCIKNDIKDNSIDAGFGFKQVIAACMQVEESEYKIIDNKKFVYHEVPELVCYGKDLTDEQKNFLIDCIIEGKFDL